MYIARAIGFASAGLVVALLSACENDGGVTPLNDSQRNSYVSLSGNTSSSLSLDIGGNASSSLPLDNSSSSASVVSSTSSSSLDNSASSSAPAIVEPPGEVALTPAPEGYTFCINEAEWIGSERPAPTVCSFEGTRFVAYGAEGEFNYKLATDGVTCNNDTLEDPIQNVRKSCFVSVEPVDPAAMSSSSASSPSSSSLPSNVSTSSSSSQGDDSDISSASASSPSSSSLPSSVSASSSSSESTDSEFVCEAPRPSALSIEYSGACAGCHGPDGSSGIGANLQAAAFNSLAGFEQIIRQGMGIMPGVSEEDYSREALLNDFAYLMYPRRCGAGEVADSCEIDEQLLKPQLRRLTQVEMVNTITAVFGDHFHEGTWPDLDDSIPTIGMSNVASGLQIDSINLERIHAMVSSVIAQLQGSVVSDCDDDSDTSCIDNLLVQYAPQLWRRPLTGEELDGLISALEAVRVKADREQQIEFVFRSLLMSPNFLFRMELGALQDKTVHLDSYEIASLLSYALWESPPDSALYDLADANQLTDQAVIDEQVDRMMADPRFEAALINFFKDFLKLERVLSVEKLADLNFTTAQRRGLLASAERMLADKVGDIDQDLMSVFSGHEFYVNSDIAPLFGLDSNQFGSELTLTSVSGDERSGVLTHPAFLAVHATAGTSGIVKRGVFTLEQLLCVDLGDPPDNLTEMELPPDIDPAITSTRKLLQLQHSHQSACRSCHHAIDPAGFGYESYDVLGRFQTVEKGSVVIDSSGRLENVIAETLDFSNHIEYVEGLVRTPEMRGCVSRRMLESFSGQRVQPNACELQQLDRQNDQNDATIRGLIKSLTQLESVRLRSQ